MSWARRGDGRAGGVFGRGRNLWGWEMMPAGEDERM